MKWKYLSVIGLILITLISILIIPPLNIHSTTDLKEISVIESGENWLNLTLIINFKVQNLGGYRNVSYFRCDLEFLSIQNSSDYYSDHKLENHKTGGFGSLCGCVPLPRVIYPRETLVEGSVKINISLFVGVYTFYNLHELANKYTGFTITVYDCSNENYEIVSTNLTEF
jgi:hypothetical protein